MQPTMAVFAYKAFEEKAAKIVRYASPSSPEAMYTTPPLSILVLCELVLVPVDMPKLWICLTKNACTYLDTYSPTNSWF